MPAGVEERAEEGVARGRLDRVLERAAVAVGGAHDDGPSGAARGADPRGRTPRGLDVVGGPVAQAEHGFTTNVPLAEPRSFTITSPLRETISQ